MLGLRKNTPLLCGISLMLSFSVGIFLAPLAEAGALNRDHSVFYVSPSAGPGQTVLIEGAHFVNSVPVYVLRLPDGAPGSPPAFVPPLWLLNWFASLPVPVQQGTATSAKFTLPSTLEPGVFIFYHDAHFSFLNIPIIKWSTSSLFPGSELSGISGDYAFPGKSIEVFGRNLTLGTAKPSLWLQGNNKAFPLTVTDSGSSPYRIIATLPANISPGNYQLIAHNGYGGQYGFSKPVPLTVVNVPAPWPSIRYDVTAYGAKGDGKTDDTAAFRNALAHAAVTEGGIVHVPAGTYLITGKLSVPGNTVLQGASRSQSIITTPAVQASNGKSFQALFAGNGHFVIQDLTITSAAADTIVTCPDNKGMYGPTVSNIITSACQDVTLSNLSVSHTTLQASGTSRSLNLAGQGIRIENSTVYAQNEIALYLQNAYRHAVLYNNIFQNGKGSWEELVDINEGIVEANNVTGKPLIGPGGTCFGSENSLTDVYIAGNNIHDSTGTGEAFTNDGPYFPNALFIPTAVNAEDGSFTMPLGSITHPGNKYLKFGEYVDLSHGYIAVVVSGTGAGQMRRITSDTPTSVNVDAPWTVPLDNTSVVALAVAKNDVVFYNNAFTNASVTAQLYALGYDIVFDSNTAHNTGGSYAVGTDYPALQWNSVLKRRFSYEYFITLANNTFHNDNIANPYSYGYRSSAFLGQAMNASQSFPKGYSEYPSTIYAGSVVPFMGNMIRGNSLNNGMVIGFHYINDTSGNPSPRTQEKMVSDDLIIENNAISKCNPSSGNVGLVVDPLAFNTLVRNNTLSSGCVELVH